MFRLLACWFWAISLPGLASGATGSSIEYVTNWPGYFAVSQPMDSYPTEESIYVLSDSLLTVITPGETKSVARVMDLGMKGCNRIHALGADRIVVTGRKGFVILNVAAPLNPAILGTYQVDQGAFLGAIDNVVYFTNWEVSRVDVIDCSDPMKPTVIGNLPEPLFGTIQDGKAYGSVNGEFQIWSISERTNRTVLGRIIDTFSTRRIYVEGSTVYVLPSSLVLGVSVIDVTDVTTPRAVGLIVTGGSIYDMAIDGSTGWLADDQNGLVKVNLDDLSEAWTSVAPLGFLPQSLRKFQDSLYSIDEADLALKIFTMSDDEVVSRERLPLPQPSSSISASGSTAVISGGSSVAVLDISDPSGLREISRIDFGTRVSGTARIGNTLFVNAGSKIIPVDLTDPANLRTNSTSAIEGIEYSNTMIGGENVLYVGTFAGLVVIDVSRPANLKSVATNKVGPVISMHLNGGYLYVSGLDDPPIILNVSNPLQPAVIGSFVEGTTAPSWCGFAQEGNLLVVSANHISGLSIAQILFYNVADPSKPRFLGYGPEAKVLVDMRIRARTLYYLSSARIRAYDLASINVDSDEVGPLAAPMIAEAVDFDLGFLGFALFQGNVLAAQGEAGISTWAAHLPARISARSEQNTLSLDFQIDPSFTYELQTTTTLDSEWKEAGIAHGESLSLPINLSAPSGFFRLYQLGSTP